MREMRGFDVIIIGGGITGLTAGVGLSGEGRRVALIEAEAHLGGRAASYIDEETGVTVDIGPHIFFSEYPNMLKLLSILGTEDRVVWQKGSIARVFLRHNKFIEYTPDKRLPPPLHFLPLIFGDNTLSFSSKLSHIRAIKRIMELTEGDVAELDKVDAETWLVEMGVDEEARNGFWNFASMAIMNVPLERASAGALMRFVHRIVGRNDYTIGFASGGLSNLFAPGAAERIERGGGMVIVGSAVKRIEIKGGVFHKVVTESGDDYFAPICISTIPLPYLSAVLPPELTAIGGEFDYLSSFEPSPYKSVYIWFDRKITDMQFWARWLGDDYLNLDFYDISNINADLEGCGSIVTSNIIYSRRVDGYSDEKIVERTIKEIADTIPAVNGAEVEHWRVHNIPMAIHCPYPGTEVLRPGIETGIGGLFIAGDFSRTALPTSMESAARAGWMAAEKALKHFGVNRKLSVESSPDMGIVAFFSGREKRRMKEGGRPDCND
ncbi:MAG: FAD-dependent oxidoreductase [Myxococcota bacterium]